MSLLMVMHKFLLTMLSLTKYPFWNTENSVAPLYRAYKPGYLLNLIAHISKIESWGDISVLSSKMLHGPSGAEYVKDPSENLK
jgi:hypothetical protein